jgi:hypothetical protein
VAFKTSEGAHCVVVWPKVPNSDYWQAQLSTQYCVRNGMRVRPKSIYRNTTHNTRVLRAAQGGRRSGSCPFCLAQLAQGNCQNQNPILFPNLMLSPSGLDRTKPAPCTWRRTYLMYIPCKPLLIPTQEPVGGHLNIREPADEKEIIANRRDFSLMRDAVLARGSRGRDSPQESGRATTFHPTSN